MQPKSLFASQNKELFDFLSDMADELKRSVEHIPNLPVNPRPSTAQVEALLKNSFDSPEPIADVMRTWVQNLEQTLLHVDHPMYFGVFNPNPLFAGVVAETLVAQFNPNLASTASAKIGIAVENKIISYFGQKAGWNSDNCEGTFCSGGTEANLTAILCALAVHCPAFFKEGSRSLPFAPAVYVSTETHHSIKKSLKLLGLGSAALREIPVDSNLQFDIQKLKEQIEHDKTLGFKGILIVGTLGSTSAGIIDPLKELGHIAKTYAMNFHVDAAWGAGALLLPEFSEHLQGIELADSMTIDTHKWFSVPMTAGIFLTQHRGVLRNIFDAGDSPYMPPKSLKSFDTEPFKDSLSWSRRFSGLKIFFCFMTIGESGYQMLFRHSIQLANDFRAKVRAHADWVLENDALLPVVCFRPKKLHSKDEIEKFAEDINASGKAWITTTVLNHVPVIRVGFPNFATTEENVEHLWQILNSQSISGP